jgi:hypothetical protein
MARLGLLTPSVVMLLGACIAASAQDYERLPAGVWSLRITNPTNATLALCARLYFNPNRPPWWGDTIYLARGGEQKEATPKEQWLAPGESSEWVDIGPHMSARPLFGGSPNYLSCVFIGAMYDGQYSNLRMAVEIARGPERRVVRRLDVAERSPTFIGYSTWLGAPPALPTLGLMIPVDPSKGERIWTLEEAAEQQLEWIDSYGPTPPQPRHIWFICHQEQVAFKKPTRLQKMQTEIVRRLGYNNLTQWASDAADIEAIRKMGVEPLPGIIIGRDDAEKTAAEMKKAGTWDYVRLANFGDEIDISLRATPEEQDAAFVADLKQHGFDPLDFVRPEDEAAAAALPQDQRWQFVHLGGPLPPEKPKLLYEAAVFRYRLWTEEMAESTRQIKANFPEWVQTGSNYSPHLSVWPDVRKWINMFRDGGMTMPWSEDWWWQVPEASPQAYGYLLDALRHAADYRNAPYCFYTIPDPGESAEDLLRMNYFALGHQAKVIDHFAIYHQAYGTCDYIDFAMSKDSLRSIHRIISDVSKVDERLYRARMRPAQVAILMPIASDVWNTEDLLSDPKQEKTNNLYWATQNVDNHERKAIWLALRHAQIPVDLITDEDVADGKLKPYKVLYLVGQELLDRAVPELVKWVENGGTLIGEGGGGLLNQYREPIPAMYDLYGIESAELQRPVRSLGPASDLPGMKALDTVTFVRADRDAPEGIPVLCYKQVIKPLDIAKGFGKYDDGSIAMTFNEVGKGHAELRGALAGLAFLQAGMAAAQSLPAGRLRGLQDFITGAARSADQHVVTSDPLVDATLQEGPLGAIVTLTGFRNEPIKSLTVSLPGLPNARTVTSTQRGPLDVSQVEGVPTVTLPLDIGDFLVID